MRISSIPYFYNLGFLYNGKELNMMSGLNSYDNGARQYYSVVPGWDRVDPLCEKYYNISPYVYCGNNPVNAIDPDGRKVKPAGDAALNMIQNTLPSETRQYVVLDSDGLIDEEKLNSYSGSSENYDNLKALVESNYVVEVRLDDNFDFADSDGNIGNQGMYYEAFEPEYGTKDVNGETINDLSTGESGFMGKTLFPDREGVQNSPNDQIQVVVNKNLSPAGAAEVYSHEANIICQN